MTTPRTTRSTTPSTTPTTSYRGALEKALYKESLDCVHCGLCLQSCPTYRVTGRETASPRGRIYLMRGLAEGRLEDPSLLAEEAFACLGCRACETACPSGVQYGEILEQARAIVRDSENGFRIATFLERFALRGIVPDRKRLRLFVSLLSIVQRLGLDRLAALILPKRIGEMTTLLPKIPKATERRRMPSRTPAMGTKRGRVALFEGCVMPEFFGRVNDAARLVLARAGYEVIVPESQGCCGALQAHSGDLEFAHGLARKNARAFSNDLGSVDAIIVTSAGCSAALREAENWIGEEGGPLAIRVRDVLEFLDEVDAELPFTSLPKRVCYDDACHLIHAQGIADAPRRLLSGIPDLKLISHRDPEACCGAAGIYNLTNPEMSKQVLQPKLDALADAAPDIVATANPGCAMQLSSGLSGRGLSMRIVHPIELLEEASRS
ncbi:MAG TPA: (Fe-S)-binding protein [Myxococcales bacterium]|nr:(Fe-S)-binding protein [Myxococcales bacterium]HIK83561.1 (Fe-S)-binding protein [Myxococcales bacterium]